MKERDGFGFSPGAEKGIWSSLGGSLYRSHGVTFERLGNSLPRTGPNEIYTLYALLSNHEPRTGNILRFNSNTEEGSKTQPFL